MGILSSLLEPVTNIVGNVIDKVVTDKDEAARLKHEVSMGLMKEGAAALEAQASIIVTEAKGSWLQRNWRPITMLTFVGLVVAKWLGFTAEGVTESVELELMQLIQIGLGGYIVGRSGEKIAKAWKP